MAGCPADAAIVDVRIDVHLTTIKSVSIAVTISTAMPGAVGACSQIAILNVGAYYPRSYARPTPAAIVMIIPSVNFTAVARETVTISKTGITFTRSSTVAMLIRSAYHVAVATVCIVVFDIGLTTRLYRVAVGKSSSTGTSTAYAVLICQTNSAAHPAMAWAGTEIRLAACNSGITVSKPASAYATPARARLVCRA